MKLVLSLNGEVISETLLQQNRDYIAGRGDGNDIQLQRFPGISRRHFRLFFENNQWQVEVVSRVENVFLNGAPVAHLDLADNSVFTLGPYQFQVVSEGAQVLAEAVGQAMTVEDRANEPASPEEHTQIGKFLGLPFIRIYSDALRIDTTLRLEGHLWVAGRDKSCAIVLEDPHTSRRHFEITQTSKGFFITDLESANHTILNGQKLQPNEPARLNSGDTISVSQTSITFELRDPEFSRKLQLVPQDMLEQKSIEVADTNPSMLPMPSDTAPNALSPTEYSAEYAKQLAAYSAYYQEYMKSMQNKTPKQFVQQNKLRVVLVGLVVLAGIGFLIKQNTGPATPNKVIEGKPGDPFNNLNTDQQAMIRDAYNLAKGLVVHRKYVLALDELKKIHQLLPSGYKDSLSLEAEATRANEIRNSIIERTEMEEREKAVNKQVSDIVAQCRSGIKPESTAAQILACLEPAINLNPNHEEVTKLVNAVQEAQATKLAEEQNKADYRKKVGQLETLCRAANKDGMDLNVTKAALRRCMNSPLPDPKGLKKLAQKRLTTLEGNVEAQIANALAAAEQALKSQDYRMAVKEVKNVKRINPRHPKALSIMDRIEADTNNKMKVLYSDSILEESYGKIELAKEKWQKIIDMGLEDSDFYRRAKRKLQRYGAM
jgi:pSer/pThr/pTyr-binding forkhead associated (FHA) protein